jgi:integrase
VLHGLEWKDINWENDLISVVRTSEYNKEKGVYTDTPKSKSSVRVIKLPTEVMDKLRKFRAWQNGYKTELGSKWVECDRLFTKWNGEPMGYALPLQVL